jgi:RNA polymerase sigma factor (sigma-70 family)
LTVNDPVLAPLLAAGSDASMRRQALEALMTGHVQPVAARVLSRYQSPTLRPEDAEDLAATVYLRLVRRLQQLDDDDPIDRLDDYVAAVTYNVVYSFLRRRYPERTRLKNRLRYLLSHHDDLAIWESGGDIVCGLAQWRERAPVAPQVNTANATAAMIERGAPAEALHAIFDEAAAPMLFDDLVRLAAELWSVSDAADRESVDRQQSTARSPALELETRQTVEALWKEVRQLRENQRAALLLNLRDVKGANGVALLLIAGVASMDEIAEAMGMPAERLAELWNELPLDDLTIGGMLGISRQQVINLRKAARERLARRMAAINSGKP